MCILPDFFKPLKKNTRYGSIALNYNKVNSDFIKYEHMPYSTRGKRVEGDFFMNNLEQFYASVGSNASEIIKRLGGDSSLVIRFLSKFQADGSFDQLCSALDSGETETAFRMAHTLKGLSANLGLQTLYEQASNVTELLRAGNLEDAKAALPALEQVYNKVLDGLKNLNK